MEKGKALKIALSEEYLVASTLKNCTKQIAKRKLHKQFKSAVKKYLLSAQYFLCVKKYVKLLVLEFFSKRAPKNIF